MICVKYATTAAAGARFSYFSSASTHTGHDSEEYIVQKKKSVELARQGCVCAIVVQRSFFFQEREG